MKSKVRKNFCEVGGLTLGKNDNIEITLDKLDIDLLRRRGFTTDTGCAGAKVTIWLEDGLEI